MSDPLQTLTYDLAGYPFLASAALLRKRNVPKRYVWACSAAYCLMLASIFIATFLSKGRYAFQLSLPLLCFWFGLMATKMVNARFNRHYYNSIENAPHRSDSRQLDMTSDGVTIISTHSSWHYPWSHISDVIAGPENTAMLIVGLYEFEPIPAKAFVDAAARDRFVESARELRAGQQVVTP